MTDKPVDPVKDEEEEDEESEARHWQSAYWAAVQDQQRSDTYTGGYRGTRPVPHGGAQSVTPGQTLGTTDYCWCGEPAGHDWPGKGIGAKHPKEGNMTQTQSNAGLDRRDLRGYHQRLQDFILTCINESGLDWRKAKNAIILYPPDGSQPMSIYARNTDRQLRSLQKWYVEHVHQAKEQPVAAEAVEELARTVNDPAEHPLDPPKTKGAERPPVAPEASVTEWRIWQNTKGEEVNEFIVTNGTQFRCTYEACVGTEHEYLNDQRSIGGHTRMWHMDRSILYEPETRAKAEDTKQERRAQRAVVNAIEVLLPFAPEGTFPNFADFDRMNRDLAKWHGKATGWERRAREAEAKVAALEEAGSSEELAALKQRAEEAEAKVALAREAMGL